MGSAGAAGKEDQNLRLALAIAIVKSSRRSETDNESARKRIKCLEDEAASLRAEISGLRSSALKSHFPPVLCKCFTDCPPVLPTKDVDHAAGRDFDEDAVRRLLECVRLLNKKRRISGPDEIEESQRAARIAEITEFILEMLSNTNVQLLSVWLHRAVDFLKSSVIRLKSNQGFSSAADSVVKNLIASLSDRIISFSSDQSNFPDYRPYIEKVLLQLSEVSYLGHRLLIHITEQLTVLSETFSHADLFGNGLCQLVENSYFLLEVVSQVMEDPFNSWVARGEIDAEMLEEFTVAFFQMKCGMIQRGERTCQLLVVYSDRICAQIIRQLHTVSGSGDEKLASVVANALQSLLSLVTPGQV